MLEGNERKRLSCSGTAVLAVPTRWGKLLTRWALEGAPEWLLPVTTAERE